ncbi:MAG: ethanolamine utilization protein [Hydrogenophilales bacterium 28-61-23]|nr:MAG: ethanolamine utilization protein [Hydrogenophilales bacterium 28-61-23]
MLPQRLAFIDLETTGANPVRDRITEIGIVEVDGDRVSTWSTLVNPEQPIPQFIQQLTGIDDAMVADAPTFAQVAGELAERLHGRLFIAHNARFDYGFVRNEFQRLGQRFRADVLCTVRLSRKLYPEHHKHNLDSLIVRHNLEIGSDRHRALTDADLIWQFWRLLGRERDADTVIEAVRHQLQRPSLPPHLDAALLDDLPETPGVYLFHGESEVLLYVGKSLNLRKRVLAHFAADTRESKDMQLAQQVRRIDWRETVGELGALLLESNLVKTGQPLHNRRPRRAAELCAWQLREVAAGDFRPRLVSDMEADFGRSDDLFGPFANPREASNSLRKIADAYALCPVVLGLEKSTHPGRPCFAHQVGKCRGACVGKEPIGLHSARLMAALAKLKLKAWPYPGPIGLVEHDEFMDVEEVHVVDGWRYLGTAKSEAEVHALLEQTGQARFDMDTYKLLKAHLGKGRVAVRRL